MGLFPGKRVKPTPALATIRVKSTQRPQVGAGDVYWGGTGFWAGGGSAFSGGTV